MIKVSDEAWRQAEETWNEHINCGNGPEKALRAALAAAVPHLQVQAGGDDGLRDALRELARERDAVGGHVGADYTIRPYELLDLLKAHPAASAVPQPAGRSDEAVVEAAAKAIYTCPPGRRLEPWDAVTGKMREEYLQAGRAALLAAVPQPAEGVACPSCHGERYRNGYCLDCGWRAVPQPADREALRGKLDQLWGWAKSGKRKDDYRGEYYLMSVENVDGFTDAVLALLSPEETK